MIEYYKGFQRRRRCFFLALLLGIAAAVLCWQQEKKEQDLQQEIASEVIRFHIRANSDRREDQELKLEVRDVLLSCLGDLLKESDGVETSRKLLKEHMGEIKEAADFSIRENGFSYPVKAYLVKEEFPEKTYGDCTFPAGTYEALRVDIGEGDGHNWWCMVYPGLCFTEETGAYVTEDGKEVLKHVLTEEEFDLVTGKQQIRFRFKLLEFLK